MLENIKIGKIVNAVSLKGEVKVYNYSEPDRFDSLEHILVKKNKEYLNYEIQNVRYQKNMVILKLKGIDDRNMAEALKESEIYITELDLRELPEDTFYIRDLIGCNVINIGTNKTIGQITDVLQNTAQDIYQIKSADGKEILIPAVSEFVKKIDISAKTVEVKLISGFLDEAIEIQ